MSIDTYYTVLGVSENASQAEIKAAYRELVRQVHPDSVPNASPYWKQAAEEKTKEINEAYFVLSDVSKRREYDRLLAEASQESPRPATNRTTPPAQQSTPQPQTNPSRPKQSPAARPKTIGDVVLLWCFLLVAAGVVFALVRTVWGALLCSAMFGALLCWRKLFKVFPQYRRWSVVAFAVSVCFVIADLVYPAEESKPAPVVRVGTPTPEPTPVQLRAQDVEVEPPKQPKERGSGSALATQTSTQPSGPSTRHLPKGVFNPDPMDGYGETKMFMGIECSWNNVDAESKKRWMESGAIPNHTFLISPSDETCYVWNQDVGLFRSKGAVRGEAVVRDNKVVGYKRPEMARAAVDRSEPEPLSSQPVSSQVPKVPTEQRSLPSSQPGPPSLSSSEEQSIEAVCSQAKYLEGPAAYNQCRSRQLELWAAGPRQPDLSALTSSERQSIEAVCSQAKYLQGPAAYNRCLVRQLELWAAGPRRPDLSALTSSERQSIEAVCSQAKYLQGPAAYNQCLARQKQSLSSYHQ